MAADPARVEHDTRSWLEGRFTVGVEHTLDPERQVYDADGRPRRVTAAHFGRLVRKML